MRALDRILRAGHYWVSNWYKPIHHIAHWDRYSRPANSAARCGIGIDAWWFDAAKAAKLKNN